TAPRALLEQVFGGKEGQIVVAPTQFGGYAIGRIDRITPVAPSQLDLLAPSAAARLSTIVSEDVLLAVQNEIQDAMALEVNDAAVSRLRDQIAAPQ
ncbi:MAG: hypothetical protein AAFQ67_08130, partial [Pseudomonadota bacterium]